VLATKKEGKGGRESSTCAWRAMLLVMKLTASREGREGRKEKGRREEGRDREAYLCLEGDAAGDKVGGEQSTDGAHKGHAARYCW